MQGFLLPYQGAKGCTALYPNLLLSYSVAPTIFIFFLLAPLKMVFPKKGSLFFQGH